MNSDSHTHHPSIRSYTPTYSSVPTITQSSALWKATRLREESERRAANQEPPSSIIAIIAKLIRPFTPRG